MRKKNIEKTNEKQEKSQVRYIKEKNCQIKISTEKRAYRSRQSKSAKQKLQIAK